MSKTKLSGRALVVRLDKDEMRLALMSLGSSNPNVQYLSVVPTPEGAVDDGLILRPDLLREALTTALADPNFKRVRRVVFSLCSSQVISETVSVPEAYKNRLDKLLKSNIDIYFPVDVSDCHLVWQILGTSTTEENGSNLDVQLWAVPNTMLARYYALANDCGLSVMAMDWCGNSIVTAVGATRTLPGGKKPAKQKAATPAETEADEAASTDLYLMAENEHMIMTFVQKGQVRMQRVFQCGSDPIAELSEAAMVMEYYMSTTNDQAGSLTCTLCGKLAENPDFVDRAREELNAPVVVLQDAPGPRWCLCVGAARTTIDFGTSSMNRPSKVKTGSSMVWQYLLILAAGLALLGVIITILTSGTVWRSNIQSLKNTQNTLQIQAMQTNGYADTYNQYVSAYKQYTGDWNLLFSSLRTYNDNLVLMLKELESILPETTNVVQIGIAPDGMSLEFSCPDKKEAAYLILTLRSLQYADLTGISNLNFVRETTATDMYPSLAAYVAEQDAAFGNTNNDNFSFSDLANMGDISGLLENLDWGSLTSAEQELILKVIQNQSVDGLSTSELIMLMGIMEKVNSGETKPEPDPEKPSIEDILGENTDQKAVLQYAIANGMIDRDDFAAAIENLSPTHKASLEAVYCEFPEPEVFVLEELLAQANIETRIQAMGNLLTESAEARAAFTEAFIADYNNPDSTLTPLIIDDLYANYNVFMALLFSDDEELEESIPEVLEIFTKNEETALATEQLFINDETLKELYTQALANAMGLVKEPEPSPMDVDRVMNDMLNGRAANSDVQAAFDAIYTYLLPLMIPEEEPDPEVTPNPEVTPDPENPIPSIPPIPEEKTRIYFSVTLSYKEALVLAELERKGLDHDALVAIMAGAEVAE